VCEIQQRFWTVPLSSLLPRPRHVRGCGCASRIVALRVVVAAARRFFATAGRGNSLFKLLIKLSRSVREFPIMKIMKCKQSNLGRRLSSQPFRMRSNHTLVLVRYDISFFIIYIFKAYYI
jgi:hypothetical protein